MKFFENLSVRAKIFSIFAMVLIVVIIIGSLGIFNSDLLGDEISNMYHHDTEPIGSISHVIQNVMTLSSSFDMAILAAMSDDYDGVREFESSVNDLYTETDLLLREVKDRIYDNEAQKVFDVAFKKYYETLVPTGPQMFEQLFAGDVGSAEKIMGAADISIGEMTEGFKACLDLKINKSYNAFLESEKHIKSLKATLAAIMAFGFVATIALAVILSASITRPVMTMLKFAKETADTGNLELSTQEIDRVAERHDEIGRTVRAFNEMTTMFRNQAQVLRTISYGDLTPDVHLKSKTDTVGTSLLVMLDEIGTMLRDVSSASKQVAQGIGQIAMGAEDLSNSISEQNNSIENISDVLHDISKNVSANLASSSAARDLVSKINQEANGGDKKMSEMVEAVHKINEASGGIGKIMKTIDDIAFQTNILALNAAVEAARAGQHGKGFSVVAEEVRNLAVKSAEAASESNVLITNSLQLTEFGVKIAEATRQSIVVITSGIRDILLFIEQISQAASDQNAAIEQLSKGISEIAETIHRTSANAEESSAACEEINALSVSLDGLVSKFKTK